VNDQPSESTQPIRTVHVHAPPRDLGQVHRRQTDKRRRDRAAGIGVDGQLLARALGISPRQLRDRYPAWDMVTARRISAELMVRHRKGLPLDF